MASNTIMDIATATKMVAMEGFALFMENLQFAKVINRQFENEFGSKGKAAGNTIGVRKPPKAATRSGRTYSAANHVEEIVSLTVGDMIGSDFEFNSSELALSIDSPKVFSERVLKYRMAGLAAAVDADLLSTYKSVYNLVGSAGTDPATSAVILSGGEKLDDSCAPVDDRIALINQAASAAMVEGLKSLVNDSKALGKQYVKGAMGEALGFEFMKTQNIRRHTVGIATGTPLVNGASQTGSSLVTDGWTNSQTGILKAGDVFTIAGVYQVSNPTGANPITLPKLQQFVVTADADSGASTGPATLSISPSIVTSGALQTVSGSPANDAAITVVGTGSTAYAQNLLFHPDAFSVAFVDLPLFEGIHKGFKVTKDNVELRVIAWYDGDNDLLKCRADVQYAKGCLRPELACRLVGK